MPHDVRTHTRKTAAGGTTTVRQHKRKGGSGKRGPNPSHAGRLGKRALAHGRRGRKAKALMFGVLCLGELALWLTLNGTAMVCALIGAALVGISFILTR